MDFKKLKNPDVLIYFENNVSKNIFVCFLQSLFVDITSASSKDVIDAYINSLFILRGQNFEGESSLIKNAFIYLENIPSLKEFDSIDELEGYFNLLSVFKKILADSSCLSNGQCNSDFVKLFDPVVDCFRCELEKRNLLHAEGGNCSSARSVRVLKI